jgi:hypothetical protein
MEMSQAATEEQDERMISYSLSTKSLSHAENRRNPRGFDGFYILSARPSAFANG